MSGKEHLYQVSVRWTGNSGSGTSSYRAYERSHEISVEGKPVIPATADPAFRGQPERYNPEELFVGALASCHQLWYLHLCADSHIVVTSYEDSAEGVMQEADDGGGQFVRVTLHPRVTVAKGADKKQALELHRIAHEKCFIARSVNFPVECEASIEEEEISI